MPRGTNFENRSQKSGEKLWRGATKAKVLPLSLRFLRFLFQDTRYMFELLARGYLSTPCKVDVPATLEHSLRVLGRGREGGRRRMGGRKLKWSHRLRECLRAQRHPPFPLLLFLPSSTDLHLHPSVPEKKTRRRILEHRGVVYNESGVNLILTPLYHQDVSHGRGHSRGTSVCI